MSDSIIVYDTTLRDGMQGEGMSLSVEEKVRVARILDELGVPMIEAGFPTSNPKELELFERLQEAGLDEGDAEIVEQVRHAHLLLRRERHPLTLHPVAQGGVVDLDPAHGAGAGAGTTSSQWA